MCFLNVAEAKAGWDSGRESVMSRISRPASQGHDAIGSRLPCTVVTAN